MDLSNALLLVDTIGTWGILIWLIADKYVEGSDSNEV